MTENYPNRDQIPTDPNNTLLTLLTCISLAAVLPPEQTQTLTALLPLTLQLLPNGRR